jgi:hypothetical protein
MEGTLKRKKEQNRQDTIYIYIGNETSEVHRFVARGEGAAALVAAGAWVGVGRRRGAALEVDELGGDRHARRRRGVCGQMWRILAAPRFPCRGVRRPRLPVFVRESSIWAGVPLEFCDECRDISRAFAEELG